MSGIPFEVVRIDPVTGEKTDADGDGNPDWITHDADGQLIVSDHAGEFWFVDLVPGDYFVRENLSTLWPDLMPSDMDDAYPAMGRLITIHSRQEKIWTVGNAHIPEGSLKEEVNVGDELVFGNYVKGSIHGFKCIDFDADGVCETTGHIVLVVDASQTMTAQVAPGTVGDVDGDGIPDTKLDAVIDGLLDLNTALAAINAGLPDTTELHVGIVIMSGGAAAPVDFGGGTFFVEPGPAVAAELLDIDLVTGGDTNFEDGLDDARALLSGWGSDAHTGNVLFISDGFVNAGDDYADEVAALAPFADNVVGFAIGDDAQLANVAVVDPGAVQVSDAAISPAISGTAAGINLPEMPHAGVPFDVYRNGVFVETVFTMDNGEFWAINLIPGYYEVIEQIDAIPPGSWGSSTGTVWEGYVLSRQEWYWSLEGVADNPIKSENLDEGLIFGNYVEGSIHGFKFDDFDADGVFDFDAGDRGAGGFNFELIRDGVVIDTQTSDHGGHYWFENLIPGEYTVRERTEDLWPGVMPSTRTEVTLFVGSHEELVFTPGAAMLEPDDPQHEVFVGTALMFGNYVKGSIHGFKFEDFDADGRYDPAAGDTPWERSPVTFELIQGDQIWPTEINEFGEFWYEDLIPGEYTLREVTEDLPDGIHPSGANEITLFVGSGQELVWADGAAHLDEHALQKEVNVGDDLTFGNWVAASIHGKKFEDMNADGVFDPDDGDMGWGGFTFDLFRDGEVVETEASDHGGIFWFTDLRPGVYTVVERPARWEEVMPSTPTEVTLFVGSGRELVFKDGAAHLEPDALQIEENVGDLLRFGNYVKGSIHGFKFTDVDADGIYDPNAGDVGAEGVVFELIQDGQVVTLETTNAEGEFWFVNLIPGDYTIREVIPPGTVPTTPTEVALQIRSRQEFAWREGAAMIDPFGLKEEIVVGELLTFGNTAVPTPAAPRAPLAAAATPNLTASPTVAVMAEMVATGDGALRT